MNRTTFQFNEQLKRDVLVNSLSTVTAKYVNQFNHSELTDVIIPEGVTRIGSYAFEGCSSLKSITIPDSVTSIGDGAFWGCSSLKSITIPDSVTNIGYGAFWECTNRSTRHARRKARPTARPTARSQVRKQLAEWSLAIRTRDKHVCALCGRSTQSDSSLRPLRLNAHHILPKKFFPDVQFEMWNGISLCPKCHTFGKFSAHKNGVFFSEWLKHSRPEQYEQVVNYLKLLNEAKS